MRNPKVLQKLLCLISFSVFLPTIIFPYETKVTPLDDNTYPAVDKSHVKTRGFLSIRKHNPDEKDLADITLSFQPDEIGTDEDASILLARKEAGKIGGTGLYFVSGTEYTNTKAIGSQTYRVVRNEKIAKGTNVVEANAVERREREVSDVFEEVLGRPANHKEMKWFGSLLASGKTTLDELHRYLTVSNEYLEKLLHGTRVALMINNGTTTNEIMAVFSSFDPAQNIIWVKPEGGSETPPPQGGRHLRI